MSSLNIPFAVKILNPHSDVNEWTGPYNSVADAIAAVPITVRGIGLEVIVIESGKAVRYRWAAGISDADLVPVQTSVAASQGVVVEGGEVKFGGTITEARSVTIVDGGSLAYSYNGPNHYMVFEQTSTMAIFSYFKTDPITFEETESYIGVNQFGPFLQTSGPTFSSSIFLSNEGITIESNSIKLNGRAFDPVELDSKADLIGGKVPASQLPASVDEIEEYANLAAFPVTGQSNLYYVALDTNKTYRWSGSAYVAMNEGLALGETSSTAYRGDRGKAAYDFSVAQAAINTAQAATNAAKADLDLSINLQTANYTLALTDRGNMVRMNVAGANTVTIPTDAAVAFPIGTQIIISQAGAGQTSIAPFDGTVTLNSEGGKRKIAAQYTAVTLIKVAANTWLLLGNLSA